MLQDLYRRTDPADDPGALKELIRLECVRPETRQATEEIFTSVVRHSPIGQGIASLFRPPRPAPPPHPLGPLFEGSPAYAYLGQGLNQPEDDREYRKRTWAVYIDADGTTHTEYDLRSWAAEGVKTALRAMARRYGRTLKEPRLARATARRPASRLARGTTRKGVRRPQ